MNAISATLTISLPAIVRNWQACRDAFSGTECGAVVKADGYGLGAEPIARALADAGCDSFFVATLSEAIALRETIPHRRLAVFHGVQAGEESAFIQHRLIPVLNDMAQLERWEAAAKNHPNNAPAILHIDTGMHRLGLETSEWDALIHDMPEQLENAQIGLLMSHLARTSDPEEAANNTQITRAKKIAVQCPKIPFSLCNSGGIFALPDAHFHLARPGCALYGISPFHTVEWPEFRVQSSEALKRGQQAEPAMSCEARPTASAAGEQGANKIIHVATLSAPILQIRTMDREEGVGYSHIHTAQKGARIATVGMGYADGLPRSLSEKFNGHIAGYEVPQVGRISMDSCAFDVSHVPEQVLAEHGAVTIIHEDQPVDALAEAAGTIGYEIFTGLGARVKRVYIEEE